MSVDWGEIRRVHAPKMWSIAWRILRHEADSLDCCQDVFVESFQRSQKKPVENWGGFLCWLTARRAIDLLRRRKRDQNENIQFDACDTRTRAAGSNLEFEELIDLVRGSLSQLPNQQAESFWLVCVEQMSYREVADQMGISVNAVGVQLHRARLYLRNELKHVQQQHTYKNEHDHNQK